MSTNSGKPHTQPYDNPAANMRQRVGQLAGFTPDGRFLDVEGRLWDFETLVLETERLYRLQPQIDFYDNLAKAAKFLWSDEPDGQVLWWCRSDQEAKATENKIRKWTSKARKKAFAQGSVAPVIWTELVSLKATTMPRELPNGEIEPHVCVLVIKRRPLNIVAEGEDPDWRDKLDKGLEPRPRGRPLGATTGAKGKPKDSGKDS